MINRHTKYDPTYHSNIPYNYRFAWARKTNRPLDLTDEEIFNIWRDGMYEVPDGEYEHDDEYIEELLGNALDTKDAASDIAFPRAP